MKLNIRLIMMRALIVLFGLSILFTSYVFFKNIRLENALNNKMHEYAQRQIDDAAQKMGAKFQAYVQIVHDAAQELGKRQWDKASLDLFLKSRIETNSDLRAFCVAFEPYRFDKSIKLYAPGYLREGENVYSHPLLYDYTLPTAQAGAHTEWYRDFIRKGRGWSEPFFGTGSKAYIVTYCSPFFSPSDKKNPAGIVEADITLDYVREIVNNLALSQRSYGFVISPKGAFVAHPKDDYSRQELTIFDIDEDQDKAALTEVNRGILYGKTSYVNKLTGRESILYYRVIPGTNLILKIVFIRDEFFPAQASLIKHNKNKITFGLIISLILLFFLMLFLFKNRYVFLIACFVGLLVLVFVFTGKKIYDQRVLTNLLNNKMHEHAQQQINDVVQKVGVKFQEYVQVVRDAAQELGERNWTVQELDLFLKTRVIQHKDIDGILIAFKPYKFDSAIKLYAPYYKRSHDRSKIISALVNFDYTLPSLQAGDNTDWYRNFIDTGEGWTEPFWDEQDQKTLITYSSRFFSPTDKKNSLGVVEVGLTLDYSQEIINNLVLNKRSYGFILSPKGAFIAQPKDEYYRNKFSILDIDKELNQNILIKKSQKILEQKNGNISYVNKFTGKQSIVYYRVIPGTNLIFGIVSIKDEFFSSPAPLVKKNKDKIIFGIFACLMLLLFLVMIFLKNNQKRLIFGLAVLLVIGVLFTGREIYNHTSLNRLLSDKMRAYAQQQIDDATSKIKVKFQRYEKIVHDAAYALEKRTWDNESLNVFLKSIIEKNTDILAVVTAFEPYRFDKSVRLYAPYCDRDGEKLSFKKVAYDYTLPTAQAGFHSEWYRDFIKTGAGWTEPYFGAESSQCIITYSSPFFSPSDKKNPMGIVEVDISLDYVRKIVNILALGKKSYGFVVSKKGTFVAHPIEELYLKGRTIFDMAKERSSQQLEEIGHQMQKQESGSTSYSAAMSGQSSELYYRAIPGTNLIMGIVFAKEEFFSEQASLIKQTKIKVTFGIVLSLILLILLLIVFLKNSFISLIIGTVCCSGFLLIGIGYLWFVQWAHGATGKENRILVFDQITIDKVVAQCADPVKQIVAPTKIKTGVLFDKVEPLSNSQIYLSGQVWQKYPSSCEASISRDFLCPQGKTSFQKKLIFQEKTEKEETYVWSVTGELVQENLLSKEFPFDDQAIELEFEHPSLNKNVLLVPDIDNYKFISPQALPGLVPSLSIIDWNLEETFFSFKPQLDEVDFGVKNINEGESKFVLSFTIQSKRSLFGLLIMYLLPLFVALLLLFFNLCITNAERIMMSISLTSGTFLGLIFAHSAMRKAVVGSTVFYLEYFYIVPYFLIILLLFDLILYAQKSKLYFIKYQDNLLAKVLFWPSFLFFMFLITGWIFW